MNKLKTGRPTIYTPELADEICECIAFSTKGIKRLCAENKHWPSSFTIFKWLRKNEEFSHQYARAKTIQVEQLVDEILDIARNGTDVNRDRLAIDTRKWLAAKLVPKIYGNRTNTNTRLDYNDKWVLANSNKD